MGVCLAATSLHTDSSTSAFLLFLLLMCAPPHNQRAECEAYVRMPEAERQELNIAEALVLWEEMLTKGHVPSSWDLNS